MGRFACPECSGPTSVIETRLSNIRLKRRRVCLNGHRFTTLEIPVDCQRKLKELVSWFEKQGLHSEFVDYAKTQIDNILLGIDEDES